MGIFLLLFSILMLRSLALGGLLRPIQAQKNVQLNLTRG
jgi:hypothetical protein